MKPPLNWNTLSALTTHQNHLKIEAAVAIVALWKSADETTLQGLIMEGDSLSPYLCRTAKEARRELDKTSIPLLLFHRLGYVLGNDLTGLGFPCLRFQWNLHESERTMTGFVATRREDLIGAGNREVTIRGKPYRLVYSVGSDRTSNPISLMHFVPAAIVRSE